MADGAERTRLEAQSVPVLVDRVGPSGHVVATDIDTRWLAPSLNLEVRHHNVVDDPVDRSGYDVIHARLVLEHLPQRLTGAGQVGCRSAPRRLAGGRGLRPTDDLGHRPATCRLAGDGQRRDCRSAGRRGRPALRYVAARRVAAPSDSSMSRPKAWSTAYRPPTLDRPSYPSCTGSARASSEPARLPMSSSTKSSATCATAGLTSSATRRCSWRPVAVVRRTESTVARRN